MSKIQFESNSQHPSLIRKFAKVVTNMSKIQFESNSQRQQGVVNFKQCCDQYVKDTI